MARLSKHIGGMHAHFCKVAPCYNVLRTTDVGPVLYVRSLFKDRNRVRAADIGCGAGRYNLLLFQHLPRLHLTCIDINESMVMETAHYLQSHGISNFSAVCAVIRNLELANNTMDCILIFNAIHHFDPVDFLKKAANWLSNNGYVFIYTRLRSQNGKSIWGLYFPGFSKRENRLYDLLNVESWSDSLTSLSLSSIEFFKFKRKAALAQLVHQAKNEHYSTFSLYTRDAFQCALKDFQKNIKRQFSDLGNIEWFDENVMIVFRKD